MAYCLNGVVNTRNRPAMRQKKSCRDQPYRLLLTALSTNHPLCQFPPLHLDVPHDGDVF
jgi:hypothetical protein